MRNYRLKKKNELNDYVNDPKLIPVMFGSQLKYYNSDDVRGLLFRLLNVACKICDRNMELLDPRVEDELEINRNDLIKYGDIIVKICDELYPDQQVDRAKRDPRSDPERNKVPRGDFIPELSHDQQSCRGTKFPGSSNLVKRDHTHEVLNA